jgi:hypothetical protein
MKWAAKIKINVKNIFLGNGKYPDLCEYTQPKIPAVFSADKR